MVVYSPTFEEIIRNMSDSNIIDNSTNPYSRKKYQLKTSKLDTNVTFKPQ